jgi:hypothetical protein
MAKRLIHVGPEDDISDLAGKLQAADPGDEVALTVPPGAQAFQTPLNVRLLRSVAMKRGVSTTIVSPDPRIQEVAQSAGLIVYASVAALEGGIAVEAPRPGFRPAGPSPRPQAPFLPEPPPAVSGGAAAVTTPPFEYVPRPIAPAALTGPETPVPPPGPVPTRSSTPTPYPTASAAPPAFESAPLGEGPSPRTGPWGAPIVAPWPAPPTEPVGSAPPPRPPFLPASPGGAPPRPGSQWTPLSAIPDDADEPVSPWAGARAAIVPAATIGVVGAPPAPVAPPPLAPPPPPRVGLSSHRQPPTPPPTTSTTGHLRLPSRRVIYGIVVGLLAVGVILFLLLGSSATVTITVAEPTLTVTPTIQGTTSTAQASEPNFILSKQVTATASATFQASPTGTQTVTAVAASTKLELTTTDPLCASGCSPLLIQEGTAFATAGNSAIFSVSQDTYVTFTADGIPGSPEVPVVDLSAGSAGNSVPAGAIDACAPDETLCGQLDITVTNPSAPTGGVDAATQSVASTSDITNWQEQIGQVEEQLGNTATADLTAKAGQEKVAVDPNGGGKSVTFTVSPTSFPPTTAGAVMTPETVTVTVTAQETLYNPADLDAVVLRDLEASSNLPAGDSLVPSQLQLNNLQVIQAGSDGSFALSVSGVDYYHGKVNLTQLAGQLTGRSPGSVQGIVQTAIPNVQSVSVDETPVGFLFMPFSSSSIHIVENFVAAPSSGSSASG